MQNKKILIGSLLACMVALLPAVTASGAGGNLRYTISVAKFENNSGWRGQWEIGDAFGSILTDALQASGRFVVLGEKDMRGEAMLEQDLAASGRTAGGKKTPAMGRMTPAQLLVKGEVTHVQSSTAGGGGGINVMGFSIGGAKDTAEVNLTIYIVDSTTGQVKASQKVVGQAGKRGLNLGYSGSAFGGNVDGFKKDNVGKACENAVVEAVEFLEKQLEAIPWEGGIMRAGDNVIVNRGTREGVEVGQVFDVGSVDELVDEDTGEVLDREMKKIGQIKVSSVREKIAYCDVISGKPEKGMTVHPAN